MASPPAFGSHELAVLPPSPEELALADQLFALDPADSGYREEVAAFARQLPERLALTAHLLGHSGLEFANTTRMARLSCASTDAITARMKSGDMPPVTNIHGPNSQRPVWLTSQAYYPSEKPKEPVQPEWVRPVLERVRLIGVTVVEGIVKESRPQILRRFRETPKLLPIAFVQTSEGENPRYRPVWLREQFM